MTTEEYNKIVWLYQEAYQRLLVDYLTIKSKGFTNYILKIDLYIIQSLLNICNRYIESEIEETSVTLNNLTQIEIKSILKTINCLFNKYNVKYQLKSNVIKQIINPVIPNNILLQENGEPILQENGEYILTN